MNFYDFLKTYENEMKSVKRISFSLDKKKAYQEYQKDSMNHLVKSLIECNIDFTDNNTIELLIAKAKEEMTVKQLGKKPDTYTGYIISMLLTPTISNFIAVIFKYTNSLNMMVEILLIIVQFAVLFIIINRYIRIFTDNKIPQELKIYTNCINDLRNFQLFYMNDYIYDNTQKNAVSEIEREKAI